MFYKANIVKNYRPISVYHSNKNSNDIASDDTDDENNKQFIIKYIWTFIKTLKISIGYFI